MRYFAKFCILTLKHRSLRYNANIEINKKEKFLLRVCASVVSDMLCMNNINHSATVQTTTDDGDTFYGY